jgi:hypothetical protein
MVTFADVNLAEDRIGGPYQAGAGGWPTVRYFNKATGYEGKPYDKKTSKAMCDELGDDQYMRAYVEDAGATSPCVLATGEDCIDKEKDFAAKWKGKPADELDKQIDRLKGMAAGSMKTDLRKWLGQRMNVLAQLKEEL